MNAKLKLVIAMVIFGSMGVFANFMDMPSAFVAFFRGLIGASVLLLVLIITKKEINKESIKKNAKWLILSGAAMGCNWCALYEAYHHTTVAIVTLCTYFAPVLIILVSPFIFKEKITLKKALCAAFAMLGMFILSGLFTGGLPYGTEPIGIILGLTTALCYGSILVINKLMKDIDMLLRTTIQVAISFLITGPYAFITNDAADLHFTVTNIVVLLILGLVHTALAYYLIFDSMQFMSAQSAAIITYIDPAVAVLTSIFILMEPMEVTGIIGAILIIGAAMISEINLKSQEKNG